MPKNFDTAVLRTFVAVSQTGSLARAAELTRRSQPAVSQQLMRLEDIVQLGYSQADVKRVTTLIDRNEYKRRQAPIGVRITQRGFGKDRRYPITCKLNFN